MFYLSREFLELSDFEDDATGKNQKINNSKFFVNNFFLVFFQQFVDFNAEIFKLNDRLRHLLFCLILGKEFSKVNISIISINR